MVQTLDISGMDKSEWRALRKQGIGGSDVAAICGLSRWKSPMNVFLDKTQPEDTEDLQSEPAYWGTVMEDTLAREFEKRTGMTATELKYLFIHPENTWARANIDRALTHGDETGILECKTASEYLHHEWKDGGIPEYYMVQLQWYFYVTGLSWGYFATLVGGNKFYHYRVERDDVMIEKLVEICSDFWNQYVMTGTPPKYDGSDASAAILKKLYPDAAPETKVDLDHAEDDDAAALIEQLCKARSERKEAEKRETEAENRLKALIKDRELAYFGGKLAFTWKNQADSRFDTVRFREEHPELCEQYTTTKMIRKFLAKVK